MELFEQGIRQRLSSDRLIGCYFVSEAKCGFKDIRGIEGESIVHEEMWKDENIYKMVGLQSFTNPVTRPVQFSITNLSTQYRSIPAIGDLFSLYAYGGDVQSARPQSSQEKLTLGGFNPKSVNFITFAVERMQSIYSAQQVNSSNVHIYSALFAFEFVKYISKCVEKKSDGNPWCAKNRSGNGKVNVR